MARTPADPTARLAILKPARKRSRKGAKASAVPMAEIAGMSWVNLRAMIKADPDFPVERRGGNGVEWIFDVRAVLDHMIAGCEATLKERRRQGERIARMAGFDVEAAPEVVELSLDEIRKLADLVSQVQRDKQRQGLLAPVAVMERGAAEYHQVVLDAFMGGVQRMDPTGTLSPAVRALVENELGNMLVRIQDAAQRWQEGIRAASQPAAA